MKTVRLSSFAIALLGLLHVASYGQVLGNMSVSEEGSIVFRTLQWPLSFNDHGGIYVEFSDSQTIDPTPNPWNRQNWANHTIVEMTGITGKKVNLSCTGGVNTFLAVASTQGITNKSLATFSTDSPTYWGSYDNPLTFFGTGSSGSGGCITQYSGAAGGGGEYYSFVLNSPAPSYSITVGAGGAASTGCVNVNGGMGGSGIIIVDEFY